jgi:predicted alpha/beta superfamily hydrolase
MKKQLILLVLITFSHYCFAQIQKPSSGKIVRIDSFQSKYVTARNIDVWLPDDYTESKKYAVLYMHDGQMLFDSTITWNKQEWMVDETVSSLLKNNIIKDVIIVGVWNGGKTRHIDYFPQKPFESLSQTQQDSLYNKNRPNGASVFNDGKVQSDNYLKFLVKELKPHIDRHFATKKDKQNTFIAGSSMGGLISMYAICEYPKVFGGAACLSTHWPGIFTLENNPIPLAFYNYLKEHLPSPKTHKIYFDYGTKTLDAMYQPLQEQVDIIMKSKGFTTNNWMTKKFEGEDHSEKAWQKRLYIPLTFLLKK